MVEQRQTGSAGEQGFMLMAVIVMVALVLVALAVAAPVVAKDIRRDKEVESEHRTQQYVRAIRLFQRKFPGQYPPSIEALEKTNNIRFLRQQYVDPLTGKADWRIIHVGENKTVVKGFFGEPLAGLATTGIGGGGGTAQVGPVNGLAAGFGGAQVGVPNAPGSTGATGTTGGTGSTGATGSSGGLGGTSISSLGSGGAGPIMGVGSSRTGDSILVPNEQTTYETWEFLYDPRIEQMYAKGAMNGGIGTASGIGIGGLNGLNGANGNTGQTGSTGQTGTTGQTGSTGPTGPTKQ